MVSLMLIVVLIRRCMSLALHHLHLPARLFSGFVRRVLLLLAMVGMEIIMIRNMGRCACVIADRE